ncbi:hypothetical protein [Mariniflexile sp. HMF6888]|uniref:hypothetical protein n=1 Tax=Mariniflexile sp. HMF6888 TaxID=3373086 RepID=UPI0037998AC0
MRNKLFVLFLITSTLITNQSCETNDSSKVKSITEYQKSLNAWENLKETNGTSYSYIISTSSVFGFGSTTHITVLNNIVTSRVYELYSLYDEDTYLGYENRQILESYTENTEALGSNESGANPFTIDELYSTCINNYLSVDADNNTIIFSVDDSNIIKDCYYITHGCQDDCAHGITITNFKWLEASY